MSDFGKYGAGGIKEALKDSVLMDVVKNSLTYNPDNAIELSETSQTPGSLIKGSRVFVLPLFNGLSLRETAPVHSFEWMFFIVGHSL